MSMRLSRSRPGSMGSTGVRTDPCRQTNFLLGITNQPNDAEAVYRTLVALGNLLYAAKQFNTLLSTEEIAQARSALEGVEKMPFTPKAGQSATDQAAEKRKILNLAKEICEKKVNNEK